MKPFEMKLLEEFLNLLLHFLIFLLFLYWHDLCSLGVVLLLSWVWYSFLKLWQGPFEFSSFLKGFSIYDEISVSFLDFFLLTFLLFIFSKTSASGMPSSDSFYGHCGSCSHVLSNFIFLPLLGLLLFGCPWVSSWKWFLTKKLSQLSPMFCRWNSTSILTRPWWYIVLSINYILL